MKFEEVISTKVKFQFVTLCTLLFLASCSNNPTSTTIIVLSSKGSMAGTITLLGNDGLPWKDASGVLISSDGSDIATLSKPDGTWQLDSIPQGTHIISFSKDGFFEDKWFNNLVPGPGIQYVGASKMGELWTAKLKIDSCTKPNSQGYFEIYYSCVDSPHIFPYVIEVNMSPAPFPNPDSVRITFAAVNQLTPGSREFAAQVQLLPPAPPVSSIFLSIMGRGFGGYEDLAQQVFVTPTLGPRSNTFELLR